MKKMKLLFGAAFVAVAMFFTSCNPTGALHITVTPESVTASPGQTVAFDVVLTPDAINGVKLGTYSVLYGIDSVLYTQNMNSSSQSQTATFDYTVPTNAALGTDIILTFKLVDPAGGNPATVAAVISVGSSTPQLVDVKSKTATYISTTFSNQMMYILGSDDVTTGGATSTDGDLAFVQQDDYGYSIVSPDCPWITELYSYNNLTYTTAGKHNTKIMKYTGAWADLTAEAIDALTITSATVSSANGVGNGVQNLTQGDIVVYETTDGRKGALKVITNAKVTKNMTADLLYQGTAAAGK